MRKFKKSKKKRLQAQEKKKKWISKQSIWAVGIVLIMTLSVVGFMWVSPGASKLEYGEYTFKPNFDPQTGITTSWFTKIDDIKTEFYFFPEELTYIDYSEMKSALAGKNVLYMTSDPEDTNRQVIGLINYEYQQILPEHGKAVLTGFTDENEFGSKIVTCENATAQMPVIKWGSSMNNSIKIDGNCIMIDSNSLSFYKQSRDLVLYVLFGVL